MSQLGRNDVLLAIATSDRAYGISVDDRFPLSDSVVTAIEDRDVRPKLTAGDFAGAAVAMADGLRTGGPADGGSGGGVPVAALVGGAAVVGGGAYLLVRRRRRAAATAPASAGAGPDPAAPPETPDPAPGEATTDLAYRANAALIALDDAVQTSEHELGLARTEFGDEAVTGFQAALGTSRNELVQAFALRQRIDDENPDDTTRRDLLGQILTLCAAADERLDAQAADFDRLRDLEQNVPQVIADLRPELNAVSARLPGTTAALEALRARYAASAPGTRRRQRHPGPGAPGRRPDRDRRGRHGARRRPARGGGGVGQGGGGGDRAGGHAARRGAGGWPTSWPRPRTGWSRRGPRSRRTWPRPGRCPARTWRRRSRGRRPR